MAMRPVRTRAPGAALWILCTGILGSHPRRVRSESGRSKAGAGIRYMTTKDDDNRGVPRMVRRFLPPAALAYLCLPLPTFAYRIGGAPSGDVRKSVSGRGKGYSHVAVQGPQTGAPPCRAWRRSRD